MAVTIPAGTYLEVHRATGYAGAPLQLSVNVYDDRGGGHGYRIAGPKYGASGSVLELRHRMTPRDARELISYLERVVDEGPS